jgi:hypothetical protein
MKRRRRPHGELEGIKRQKQYPREGQQEDAVRPSGRWRELPRIGWGDVRFHGAGGGIIKMSVGFYHGFQFALAPKWGQPERVF